MKLSDHCVPISSQSTIIDTDMFHNDTFKHLYQKTQSIYSTQPLNNFVRMHCSDWICKFLNKIDLNNKTKLNNMFA